MLSKPLLSNPVPLHCNRLEDEFVSSDSVGQHERSAACRGVGRGLPDLPDMKQNKVMSCHVMSCHVTSPDGPHIVAGCCAPHGVAVAAGGPHLHHPAPVRQLHPRPGAGGGLQLPAIHMT